MHIVYHSSRWDVTRDKEEGLNLWSLTELVSFPPKCCSEAEKMSIEKSHLGVFSVKMVHWCEQKSWKHHSKLYVTENTDDSHVSDSFTSLNGAVFTTKVVFFSSCFVNHDVTPTLFRPFVWSWWVSKESGVRPGSPVRVPVLEGVLLSAGGHRQSLVWLTPPD